VCPTGQCTRKLRVRLANPTVTLPNRLRNHDPVPNAGPAFANLTRLSLRNPNVGAMPASQQNASELNPKVRTDRGRRSSSMAGLTQGFGTENRYYAP
jgi:hypothetical protein